MDNKSRGLWGAVAFAMMLALSFVALMGTNVSVAFAADSGTWGTCQWQIYSNGELRVGAGQGNTVKATVTEVAEENGVARQFTRERPVSPWREEAARITSVRFENGVYLPYEASYLFEGMTSLASVQIDNAEAGGVGTVAYMFKGCSSLAAVDIHDWNAAGVYDVSGMFDGCSSLASVSLFTTGNALSRMSGMFKNCAKLGSVSLKSLETGNVFDMASVFEGCSTLTSAELNWNTQNVQNMSSMFNGCAALTKVDSTKNIVNLSTWTTSSVMNMEKMFSGCASITEIDLSGWNTANVANCESMFAGTTISKITVGDAYQIKSAQMFPDCTPVDGLWWSQVSQKQFPKAEIVNYRSNLADTYSLAVPSPVDTGKWGNCAWEILADGTLQVKYGTGGEHDRLNPNPWIAYKDRIKKISFENGVKLPSDVSYLFARLTSVTSVDLSGIDASSATNLEGMFYGCTALTAVDLSGWNTSRVTNMSSMFEGCSALTSAVFTGWNTAKVTRMERMFLGCKVLTSIDLSGFVTTSLENMALMFKDCSAITSINLAGWSTAKVNTTNMLYSDEKLGETYYTYGTFAGCTALSEFTVGDAYDMKSAELFPAATAADGKWWSKVDKTRYTKQEIVKGRSKVADTYYAVSQEEEAVTPVKQVAIKGHSLTLESLIKLNFSAEIDAVPADELDSLYMDFKYSDGVSYQMAYKDSYKNDADGRQVFSCPVNALQMADTITATLIWASGTSEPNSYSVKDYMDAYIARDKGNDPGMSDLIHSTKNYGHYAQEYLTKSSTLPAFSEVTVALQEQAKTDTAPYGTANMYIHMPNNKWNYGMTLSLNSTIDLNVKFTVPSGLSNPTATVDGLAAKAVKESDGRYTVTVAGIEADSLSESHTITLSAGNQTATVTASALTWVNMALNSNDYKPGTAGGACAASIWYYSDAADAYTQV